MPYFSLHKDFFPDLKSNEFIKAFIKKNALKLLLDTINDIQEGIISHYIRCAGRNSNRKSWVAVPHRDSGTDFHLWLTASTDPSCLGKEPALGTHGRGDEPSLHCTAKPDQSWAPHFIWAEDPWFSLYLQQSSGKGIHTQGNFKDLFLLEERKPRSKQFK